MGNIRWYRRDPDAALNGMAVLTLEERGAYNTILDLIYSLEGNLPDDERSVARCMGCDVRVWRRIRARLIELGKLYVHGGNLHNGRSDKEIYAAQHLLYLTSTAAQHPANFRRTYPPKSKKSATITMLKTDTTTSRKKER